MRFIDQNRIAVTLPISWEDDSYEALFFVCCFQDVLEEALEMQDGVWKKLSTVLRSASNGRCWYCESPIDRDDPQIDHFRPKGAIYESPDHPGYWWLAFEWSNFRFSCRYCNQIRTHKIDSPTVGGKSTHFPIEDETRRAKDPYADLGREEVILLDPCVEGDHRFLWLLPDGEPAPNPELCFESGVATVNHERVLKSISIYHLNKREICERRIALYNRMKQMAQEADGFYKIAKVRSDRSAQTAWNGCLNDIHNLCYADSPDSRAAYVYARQLSSDFPFLKELVACNTP